jgi:hypothetical protein
MAGQGTTWQDIEEQALDAYREWPIWLVIREKELAIHLDLVAKQKTEGEDALT